MSLLATASMWNTNDSAKKRNPTMRKTMKKVPALEKDLDNQYTDDNYERPTSFEEDINVNDERSERVNQLINNMSSVLEENDGNKLADFNPIPLPNMQKKTDENQGLGRSSDDPLPSIPNHLQLHPPKIEKEGSNFVADGIDLGNSQQPNPYGNYRRIYEPTRMTTPVQYQTNNTQNTHSIVDNKLLEKVNYMIYMLEQQQNEKTSNITEEFVLYTFLGVFIIFIADSFARSGKYIR